MDMAQILLVDDDPALLQALPLTVSLRMSNVQVHTAVSVTEALELLQQHEYDAIVSDIKMPGTDGFDLLAIASRKYPEVPVLLITGHGQHDLAIRALRGGAYDYILKPIDRDDLVASLYRALQTRRLRKELQVQQQALEHYALDLERLVEQRTDELRAAQKIKQAELRTGMDELSPLLARLNQATQQMETAISTTERSRTLEQGLTSIKHSLQQLESLAAHLQRATSIQQSHIAYEQARM